MGERKINHKKIAQGLSSRSPELLKLAGVSPQVVSLWEKKWRGQYGDVLQNWQAVFENCSDEIDRALAELAGLGSTVCIGRPFFEPSATATYKNKFLYSVYCYLKATSFHWSDHSVTLKSLCTWFFVSLFDFRSKGSTWCCLFLIGHICSIKGWTNIGFFLASFAYRGIIKRNIFISAPLFSSIVLAAYPYTHLITGRLGDSFEKCVVMAERHLVDEAYYSGIFQICCLYAFAYRGDSARTDAFCAKFLELHKNGFMERYNSIARVTKFLPLVLRGLGERIREEFFHTYKNNTEDDKAPLINSQFYRVSAIILLGLGEFKMARESTAKAIRYREITNSFHGWGKFDKILLDHASNEKPLDFTVDELPLINTKFRNIPKLDLFLMKAYQLTNHSDNQSFVPELIKVVSEFVNATGYQTYPSSEMPISHLPLLRVGEQVVLFRVDEERIHPVRDIVAGISPFIEIILDSYKSQRELEKANLQASRFELIQQVNHDIRSPLAALNVGISALVDTGSPEIAILRKAAKRISDILDLLAQSGTPQERLLQTCQETFDTDNHLPGQNIYSDICEVISEKRIQYKDSMNIHIKLIESLDHFPLFAKYNPRDFKRSLSNAINNSIEAIGNKEGLVSVSIEATEETVEVKIQDTGCGIQPEEVGKIFDKGYTKGKEKGCGLGLYLLKKFVESWGGEVRVESAATGTLLSIILKRESRPKWFVPHLSFQDSSDILILDDDDSIHQVWKKKLQDVFSSGTRLHHFNDIPALTEYVHGIDLANYSLLVDYQVGENSKSGLDFIVEQDLQDQAYLVTSHGWKSGVYKACEAHGVKMIPKAWIQYTEVRS